MTRYTITVEFIGGLLDGLTHTSIRQTDNPPMVGWVCENPVGHTSPYRVVRVEKSYRQD